VTKSEIELGFPIMIPNHVFFKHLINHFSNSMHKQSLKKRTMCP